MSGTENIFMWLCPWSKAWDCQDLSNWYTGCFCFFCIIFVGAFQNVNKTKTKVNKRVDTAVMAFAAFFGGKFNLQRRQSRQAMSMSSAIGSGSNTLIHDHSKIAVFGMWGPFLVQCLKTEHSVSFKIFAIKVKASQEKQKLGLKGIVLGKG